ncbi:hypothetical protein HYH02_010186 [Chlamydomonas schloesseri]|uniref:Uncharacterized protein n=1 Tax=Chlamydomonas schloesseri TaxID=2026947 RepID=A0A835W4T5_9CHLO|nr:hypothetical protein HYH02_010186 [Chlamydomonas schloesseri]|eukprot:KAG2440607.1 hypothetical protein HYH02_010186 [Chlamydomonas schloesseri]
MAYAAKTYQRNWGYDPHADDFNARVGKILSGGLDLQASMRTKALGELASTRAFEAAEREAQRTNYVAQHMNDDPGMNARVPDSRKPNSSRDAAGFVWVDEKGQYMGHVVPQQRTASRSGGVGTSTSGSAFGAATGATAATATTRGGRPKVTERQAEVMGMDPVGRSMHLWRRVNPGCVEETTRLPRSTFTDHFGSRSGVLDAEVPDKTFHLKKTDFSEYTEVKLKIMQNLKS